MESVLLFFYKGKLFITSASLISLIFVEGDLITRILSTKGAHSPGFVGPNKAVTFVPQ